MIPEIPFKHVRLVTDEYMVEISIVGQAGNEVAEIKWKVKEKAKQTHIRCKDFELDAKQLHPIDMEIAAATKGSIFFPTFRRMEGGFSISEGQAGLRRDTTRALQQALSDLARTLTYQKHSFEASISTDNIETLLTVKYADASKRAIKLQTDLSELIEKQIKGFNDSEAFAEDKENLQNARTILTEIQGRVRQLESTRGSIFKPFETLNSLIHELMREKGIRIKDITTFGDIKKAIEAPKLSAGEKQMLSFLCYNAFATNNVILIDEPEISLHVDWQRVLFPKLLEQGSNNQFIVATHSPFIYSKYPDKEIMLDADRGEGNG